MVQRMMRSKLYQMHGCLHTLWSRAASAPGYNKGEWKEFSELINEAARELWPCKCGGWLAHAVAKFEDCRR